MTKELEQELFDRDPMNFLEDSKLDLVHLSYGLETELRECTLPEDDRPPLEKFKDYSRLCCPLSEIRSVLCMNSEELDKLAQSGGFQDAADLMEYYKQETLDTCFRNLQEVANRGNCQAKSYLKRHLPKYEMKKRGSYDTKT